MRFTHLAFLDLLRMIASAVIAALYLVPHAAVAAPGDLDTSFGAGFGKTVIPMAVNDLARAVYALPDGKAVIFGECDTPQVEVCAVRVLGDGSIDATFGNNGRTFIPNAFGSVDISTLVDVVRGTNGGYSVLIRCTVPNVGTDTCVLRLTDSGVLDSSFANGGLARVSLAGYNVYGVRIFRNADGSLVAVAMCDLANVPGVLEFFCSFRLNSDGTLDTSYGSAGIQLSSLLNLSDATSAAMQPDGKLVVAGRCRSSNVAEVHFCSLRIGTNGLVDNTWGTNGAVITAVPPPFLLAANVEVALQPSGTVVMSGTCGENLTYLNPTCLVRYTSNGVIDPIHGQNIVKLPQSFPQNVYQVETERILVQPDGRLLFIARCLTPGIRYEFCVARVHADGTLDASFGVLNGQGARDGYVITQITTAAPPIRVDYIEDAQFTSDGKLLMIGYCNDSSGFARYCAARYELEMTNAKRCTLDIDGDGEVKAASDGLINLRAMLGIRGNELVSGIAFAAHATRTTGSSVRDYLTQQCGMSL
jgi:uncharacterized delta-60 repeat protein